MDFATERGPGRVILVDLEREALLVGEVVGVGMGVEKDRREETPTGKGRARKKYASEGQQLVGTATSTGNVREVEEVVGIMLIIRDSEWLMNPDANIVRSGTLQVMTGGNEKKPNESHYGHFNNAITYLMTNGLVHSMTYQLPPTQPTRNSRIHSLEEVGLRRLQTWTKRK
jgi:hypothetical protein